ncbi:hypothetical protein [Burkholderia stabilis]|uniref:hypothetical protein n=1 Tax=Burkholderia stabilis TaxID=95485 RepID=UPI0012EAEBD1|nr:hypothetical protein [Burkholderia stabilis]HDR9490313.1 hypothetical protein [Burkholderia stabilis]HDR9521400.1 hypothetical protein [Burkholderia stabilis]HDR9529784.1 hypothetical protein [Burkholderia stabilis]HDR9537418.1 hypothetical protein [Burkholderia stabilis]HDR9548288.1 hypothetical protein [Burkholderia stabilis]
MRRNIADWRAVRARPIAYRIASNFPIASDYIAITFNALTEAGKFNRFSVHRATTPVVPGICCGAEKTISLFPDAK